MSKKFCEPCLTRRNTQSKSAVYSNKRQDVNAIAPFSQKSFGDTPFNKMTRKYRCKKKQVAKQPALLSLLKYVILSRFSLLKVRVLTV